MRFQLYDILEKPKYGENKKISGCEEKEGQGRDEQVEDRGFLEQEKYSVLYYKGGYIRQNPQNICNTERREGLKGQKWTCFEPTDYKVVTMSHSSGDVWQERPKNGVEGYIIYNSPT